MESACQPMSWLKFWPNRREAEHRAVTVVVMVARRDLQEEKKAAPTRVDKAEAAEKRKNPAVTMRMRDLNLTREAQDPSHVPTEVPMEVPTMDTTTRTAMVMEANTTHMTTESLSAGVDQAVGQTFHPARTATAKPNPSPTGTAPMWNTSHPHDSIAASHVCSRREPLPTDEPARTTIQPEIRLTLASISFNRLT